MAAGKGTRILTALLASLLAFTAVPTARASDESGPMLLLRTLGYGGGAPGGVPAYGWDPGGGDGDDYCAWEGVTCNPSRQVVALRLVALGADEWPSGGRSLNATMADLLPLTLVQLEGLQELSVAVPASRPMSSPLHWELFHPGVFPHLQRLDLELLSLSIDMGSLPAMNAGALPALRHLSLRAPGYTAALPKSWGRDPGVLPSLERLYLQLRLLGVPDWEWGLGFRRLQQLRVEDTTPRRYRTCPGGTIPPGPLSAQQQDRERRVPQLHAEWADGFPALRVLRLAGLRLGGGLPPAWLQPGAFPALQELQLVGGQLSGPLPPTLFSALPALQSLVLDNNCFNGTLPADWARSKAALLSLAGNALTGPAFPPAWLEGGSLNSLKHFLVGGTALTGTLPPGLAWPKLQQLEVWSTGLQGSIPADWCHAPFARLLERVWLADSNLSGELPLCANRSMPQLQLMQGRPEGDGGLRLLQADALRQAPQPAVATPLAGLAATLAAAGLAAAASATLLWRRRHTRHAPGEQQPLLALPLAQRGDSAPLAERGGGDLSSQGRRSSGTGVASALPLQRARLAQLLQRHTSASGGKVALLHMPALSAAVAHQLDGGGDGNAADARHGVEAGVVTGPLYEEGQHGGPVRDRQWGLDTASLQLHDKELELVSGPDGQLVELGAGAFAVVYLGRLGGAHVAVKAFELEPGTDSGGIWREAALLRECCHPHVVPLLGVAVQGSVLLLAMELMRGGSLRAALAQPDKRERLRWPAGGQAAATQLASALAFLHARSVLHGDLSSSNVLLDERCNAFIGDLGVARCMGGGALSAGAFCMTHAAPEQVLGKRCSLAADVYSLGILMIELITGRAVSQRRECRLPRPPCECSQAALDLVEACLAIDPQQRPSAAEVLRRLEAEAAS